MYSDYVDDYSDNNIDNNENNNDGDKEKIKRIVFFVLVFVVLILMIVLVFKGCSNLRNSNNSSENKLVPTVNLNRENLAIEVDESFQLYVDVLNTDNLNPLVTWTSDDSNIVSVDNNGYLKGINEGITNIIVTYEENGNVYTSFCSVTVTSKKVLVEGIDILQDDITLSLGKSILLQVKVTAEDAKLEDNDLVFSSDDPKIATVSSDGYINAISEGKTTIRAKTKDGLFSDFVSLVVNEFETTIINPTSIQLIGISNGLKVGSTAKVIYDLKPNNTTNSKLTWTSSNTSIAKVNENGVITGVGAGTCTIMATTSNNLSSKLEITVEANHVPVTGITITSLKDLTLETGGTKKISYQITPTNATNKKVKFLTSDSNVATVNSNGLITAVGSGNAIITIVTEDGNKRASLNVTVKEKIPNNVGTGSINDADCNSEDMIIITHNGSSEGTIISSIKFTNAKPFTNKSKTPTITIKDFANCLNYANYSIYYGTSSSNISSTSINSGYLTKIGDEIKLTKGSGYYKIVIKGMVNNGKTLEKTYYAIVKFS